MRYRRQVPLEHATPSVRTGWPTSRNGLRLFGAAVASISIIIGIQGITEFVGTDNVGGAVGYGTSVHVIRDPAVHALPPAADADAGGTGPLATPTVLPQAPPPAVDIRVVAFDEEGMTSAEVEKQYPGRREALDGMFAYEAGALADTRRQIRELHASYPPGKPKAAIFVLAYPIHCGVACESPFARRRRNINDCTQRSSIVNLAASLQENLFNSFPYPMVIFEPDWLPEDKAAVQAAVKTNVFWQRVTMDENTLPSYYDNKEAVLAYLREYHPGGNLTLPNPDFHGYGYRLMCRFFSGLIFHAPVMDEFDYYMRLDGGDSRIRGPPPSVDPFAYMARNELVYGFIRDWKSTNKDFTQPFHDEWRQAHPEVNWNQKLLDRYQGERHPVMFYNNFEAVDMRPFRRPVHWSYFRYFDAKGVFMCGPENSKQKIGHPGGAPAGMAKCKHSAKEKGNGIAIGDADFRSITLSLVAQPHQIQHFGGGVGGGEVKIHYAHPVPNWCEK